MIWFWIRQRRKILASSSVSSSRLVMVVQSGQLSQSAPSIMEPLLGPRIRIQARANSEIDTLVLCTNQVKLLWLIFTLKNVFFFSSHVVPDHLQGWFVKILELNTR